jgi:hypothetical protein
MGLFKKRGGGQNSSDNEDQPPNTSQQPQQPEVATTSKAIGHRKPSQISLVTPSEVTEASLKVWKQLPSSIRHDPSMVSFQQEHERWKGNKKKNFIQLFSCCC